MIVFLVIVSLTLNILTFIVIAILYLRQNKLIKLKENLKKSIIEMEELISGYLLQMKEENDQFIHQLIDLKKNNIKSQPTSITDKKGNHSDQNNQNNIHNDPLHVLEDFTPRIEKTLSHHAFNAYQKQNQQIVTHKNSEKTSVIVDLQEEVGNKSTKSENLGDQITFLRKQGYSIEEMAKKLNKGKTEIELLLKFQENIYE
ncbi:hypothetical protein [Niallia sp. Krafla_26]|uniref:hypothetical protein n=1 Tax=Niallia sp. Krafla_26 TaxID=3064703 RepID=UPI003D185FAF